MKIGTNLDDKEDVKIDLTNLIETRLLITANSGGGKSWCIRKLVEESADKVQQIIIDLEGEFASLREKYDFILVGKDGEISANIKTAELLARKLLELNTSAIIDLSELKHHERLTYVQRFIDSMIESPKELWHPVLVVVDEAHQFCPEKEKSESASSIIDLATRGRKRGFCCVLATQRISKLSKDAAAECNNQMTGRTGLDIDRKRAAENLGFTSKEQERGLRELNPGEFLMFGPAISKGVIKVKIGDVKTTHPKSGGRQITKAVPPSDKIKKILQKVTDLPKEAEAEIKTKEQMQKRINELAREVRVVKMAKSAPVIDTDAIERAKQQAFETGVKETELKYQRYVKPIEQNMAQLKLSLTKVVKDTSALLESRAFLTIGDIPKTTIQYPKKVIAPIIKRPAQVTNRIPIVTDGEKPLRDGAMKMLGWLATFYPEPLSKEKVATLSGFSVRGGTFNTYLSELKRNGWIAENGELSITEDGLNNAQNIPEKPTSSEAFIEMWAGKFRDGAAKIFRFVCESYPNQVTKEEIGDATGFAPEGGTFNTYISELRRNGLIKVDANGVTASSELFE